MLALDVKRGVATTTERVFNASEDHFGSLEILWTGKTAGIIFDRCGSHVNAKILFPSIDEKSNIPQARFNNLIGYALHELGHAWYTDNAPWDEARNEHGSYVNSLINGLEDPRIERKVINSGYAPNARVLFETLINSILARDGYVDPLDKRNIPFLLAVEGRRLNGYSISVASIISKSPWAKHINWALKQAQLARDTSAIVKIAIKLFARIKEQEQQEKKKQEQGQPDQPQDGDGNPQDGDGDQQDGNPTDGANGESEGEGKGSGQSPATDDSDESEGGSESGQGDKQDGQDGQDGQGDKQDGDKQDGDKQDGDQQDGDQQDGTGQGKSDTSFDGGREVEPSDFIKDELSKHSSSADEGRSRPAFAKPTYATFTWD